MYLYIAIVYHNFHTKKTFTITTNISSLLLFLSINQFVECRCRFSCPSLPFYYIAVGGIAIFAFLCSLETLSLLLLIIFLLHTFPSFIFLFNYSIVYRNSNRKKLPSSVHRQIWLVFVSTLLALIDI